VNNECVALWLGDRLGAVERACLRSVARHHATALYCYGSVEAVPHEVEVRDANEILPYEVISQPWCARADLYSDWFRYELQRRSLGTWVDTDIYLLSPLDMESEYLFGIEARNSINGAVLRMPAKSRLLADVMEPFLKRTIPRWLPWRNYARKRVEQLFLGKFDLTDTPWGATGPDAITAMTRKHGLTRVAQPLERFYPVHWDQARWIADPMVSIEDVITEETVAIHLWNYCISDIKEDPAPPGTFLERLQREGAID
jgi:hypothetical protein